MGENWLQGTLMLGNRLGTENGLVVNTMKNHMDK